MAEQILPDIIISDSPENSDGSDISSDTESLSELENSLDTLSFGHPLERMVPVEESGSTESLDRSNLFPVPSRSSSNSSNSCFVYVCGGYFQSLQDTYWDTSIVTMKLS